MAILAFEPNIHALMSHWENSIGILSWVFGFLWILGITNATNLIDGIDGLAGSMSMLSGCSILILLIWAGNYGINAAVYISVLLPALAAFLFFNWNPAKIFLGDNGSLPVGMILSSASLMGYAQTTSWVMVLSLILIYGYPILDMAICVLTRFRKRQAIFKGDRVHLHFRIAKLGLSVRQTVGLLIMIGFYLQVSALTVNLMDPPAALLGLILVFFSIFTLLFLVHSIEGWKVSKVFAYIQRNHNPLRFNQTESRWNLSIDLTPLLEKSSGHMRTLENVQCLESLLRTLIRSDDTIILSENNIIIIFSDPLLNEAQMKSIKERFQLKVNEFIFLFNIECTTANLQLNINRQVIIKPEFVPLKATGS